MDGSVENDDLPSFADNEKEAHRAMAKWFIHAEINPNTIKTPSFAKFMSFLNPKYPPSVPKVEREILEVHEECNEKAKKFLNGIQGQLTLS